MASAIHAKPQKQKKKHVAKLRLSDITALDVVELVSEIQQGFAFTTFEELVERTGFSRDALANAIQVPLRTLARRKEDGRFRADESDRLLRLARIFNLCVDLFEGDISAARAWLTTRQLALGDATPIDYVRTEVGAREVETLIGRLEHGIPS